MFVQVVSDHEPRDLEKMGIVIKTTLTDKRYNELLVAEERLRRLEVGGVDNWDWYSESLNMDGEPSMGEFEESLNAQP